MLLFRIRNILLRHSGQGSDAVTGFSRFCQSLQSKVRGLEYLKVKQAASAIPVTICRSASIRIQLSRPINGASLNKARVVRWEKRFYTKLSWRSLTKQARKAEDKRIICGFFAAGFLIFEFECRTAECPELFNL